MKKLMILIVVSMLLLTGCNLDDELITDDEELVDSRCDGDITVTDYRDPETGVHYLIYADSIGGGITVRYTKEGYLMVD